MSDCDGEDFDVPPPPSPPASEVDDDADETPSFPLSPSSSAHMTNERISHILQTVEEGHTQFVSEGKTLAALDLLEQAAHLRRALYGVDSDEFRSTISSLASEYNHVATTLLRENDSIQAERLLRQAETLTDADRYLSRSDENRMLHRKTTLANLSTLYRKQGLKTKAMRYAERALRLESMLVESGRSSPSSTFLVMVSALSGIGRHREALEFAGLAIRELEDSSSLSADISPSSSLLAIAYHNRGVEHEFLGNMSEAKIDYRHAYEIALEFLGEDDPVTNNLHSTYKSAAKLTIPPKRSAKISPLDTKNGTMSRPMSSNRISSSSRRPQSAAPQHKIQRPLSATERRPASSRSSTSSHLSARSNATSASSEARQRVHTSSRRNLRSSPYEQIPLPSSKKKLSTAQDLVSSMRLHSRPPQQQKSLRNADSLL